MASIEETSTPEFSGVFSLPSQPNSSSFKNSSTNLDTEMAVVSSSGAIPSSVEENITPKSTYGGGITCCVPNCSSNSVRNKRTIILCNSKRFALKREMAGRVRMQKLCPVNVLSTLFGPFCGR